MELVGIPQIDFNGLSFRLKNIKVNLPSQQPTGLAEMIAAFGILSTDNDIIELVFGLMVTREQAAILPNMARVIHVFDSGNTAYVYALIRGTVSQLRETAIRLSNADEYALRDHGNTLVKYMESKIDSLMFKECRKCDVGDGTYRLRD